MCIWQNIPLKVQQGETLSEALQELQTMFRGAMQAEKQRMGKHGCTIERWLEKGKPGYTMERWLK